MKTKLAQISCFLFMLYIFWYREAYDYSSVMLYGATLLVVCSTLIYINRRPLSQYRISKGIKLGYVFGIVSFVTGLVVAKNVSLLVSSLITYFAFLIVCTCICIICKGETDINWLRKSFLIVSFICAFSTIFNGYDYYNGIIVRTMGPNNNPNTLGVLMVFGLFMLLYDTKISNKKMLFQLFGSTLFFYVIVITGSKKSLFSAGILALFWVFSFIKLLKHNASKRQKMIWYIGLAFLIGAACWFFIKKFSNTVSFARLQVLFTSGSTSSRKDMYYEAWDVFTKNPIFGVGYNQFRVVSTWKQYAHSTYAEVLADCGIFGSLIYFTPILGALVTELKKILNRSFTYKHNLLFALICIELFLGTVNIFMYSFAHMMIWCLIYTLIGNERIIYEE